MEVNVLGRFQMLYHFVEWIADPKETWSRIRHVEVRPIAGTNAIQFLTHYDETYQHDEVHNESTFGIAMAFRFAERCEDAVAELTYTTIHEAAGKQWPCPWDHPDFAL